MAQPVEVSLRERDLEAAALLYGELKSLRGLSPEDDAAQGRLFDSRLSTVMGDLARRLDGLAEPAARSAAILDAKAALNRLVVSQLAAVAFLIQPALGSIVEKLAAQTAGLQGLYSRVGVGWWNASADPARQPPAGGDPG